MKKLITSALCAVMTLSLSAAAFAAEPMVVSPNPASAASADTTQGAGKESQPGYTLQIDGKDIGVRACIMVPLRAVAEKLNFTITWNGDGTILIDDGIMRSTITIGKDLYQVTTSNPDLVGMSAPFSLGVPPYIVNGTTYAPLGLFDALLGSQGGAVTIVNGVIRLNTDPLGQNSSVQIPNPSIVHESLEQAVQAAGFDLTIPDVISGSGSRIFQTIQGELLEVIYRMGENETARIRKAPGSENISGDYTVYPQVNVVSVKGNQVTMSGSNEMIRLAVWTNSGYTYAVSVDKGISRSDMVALVSTIQ